MNKELQKLQDNINKNKSNLEIGLKVSYKALKLRLEDYDLSNSNYSNHKFMKRIENDVKSINNILNELMDLEEKLEIINIANK